MGHWTDNELFALATILAAQVLTFLAAGHAILKKRDPRSAAGWAALIFLAPMLGTILYWLFGINRIERKAKKIYHQASKVSSVNQDQPPERKKLDPEMLSLSHLTSKLCPFPLRRGNEVHPLVNGEQAYPAMLEAISNARSSVLLSTFIFDNDEVGKKFINALSTAVSSGAQVKVLVDDIGARYSFPTVVGQLRKVGVEVKRFHRVLLPWFYSYSQLRSHRKLLIVDGKIAFVGGMNIRTGHVLTMAKPKKRTQDVHFQINGPVIKDLHQVFAQDWKFSSKKNLDTEVPSPELSGDIHSRVIPNQPRESLGEHRWTLMGALSSAKHEVNIVTPYFLPDQEMISALGTASLKGVRVRIYIPSKNNHALAHWASMANIWQVLETGCEVYLTAAPFDHSKIMVLDNCWSFIGSTNWDARSFRLNFELNLECYDSNLARKLCEIIKNKRKNSSRLTIETLSKRAFPIRLRDAAARLLTPYL